MLRVLLSPRMLAFHALVVLVVPSFIWLGFWQLSRWEEKSAVVDLQESNMAADPVPVDRLTGPRGEVSSDERWRSVTSTGHYDTEHELLVRNRNGSGGLGMHVLTPLVTDDGTALLVNRGWIEQPPTATSQPDVPPPPEGEVTVTGRLQYSETEESTGIRSRGGLPEDQIMIVNVDRIAEDLPYPVYVGYAELTEQRPAGTDQPAPVSPPDLNTGMNLSYAVQWWVFTAIAIGGWGFLMRREVIESRTGGDGPEPGGFDAADAPDGPRDPGSGTAHEHRPALGDGPDTEAAANPGGDASAADDRRLESASAQERESSGTDARL